MTHDFAKLVMFVSDSRTWSSMVWNSSFYSSWHFCEWNFPINWAEHVILGVSVTPMMTPLMNGWHSSGWDEQLPTSLLLMHEAQRVWGLSAISNIMGKKRTGQVNIRLNNIWLLCLCSWCRATLLRSCLVAGLSGVNPRPKLGLLLNW